MRDDGDSTQRLDVPEDGSTIEIDSPEGPVEHAPDRVPPAIRRWLDEGWLEVIQAAALAFLVLLVAGSVLILAAKLNFPSIGTGGDLLDGLNAIVMAGLAILGVPVVFEDVSVAVLPLGALVGAGWGIAWAVRTTITPPEGDARRLVTHGARLAIPFALLCWLAALIFRFRGGHPVAANAGAAFILAAFWGALFGALGTLQTRRSLRAWAKVAWDAFKARRPIHQHGVAGAGLTLTIVTVAATGALLLWIIISLARDAPGRYFGAGDAAAYIVYLVAMLPNAVTAVTAIAFGSGVDVGARLNLAGDLVGPVREYSLWTWGTGDPPAVAYALIVIPVVACVAGGFFARRRAADNAPMAVVLLTMSGVVTVVLSLIALLAKMRLAGIGRGGGYVAVAPDVVVLFVAGFLASGVLGALGWKLAEMDAILAKLGGRRA